MTSTRELVLKTLLNEQRCTINQLAAAVEINPISVRHHINKLEAEGLVTSEEERHGVGRPRRIYFLTNAGMEKFPSRYLHFSIRLLAMLKENLPPETIKKIFTEMATDMISQEFPEKDIQHMNIKERIELVKDLLAGEGFTIEVEEIDGVFHIRETSCPYVHVGKEHREICIVDEAMISTMLDTPVQKTHCILDGDAYCAYITPTIPATDIQMMEN